MIVKKKKSISPVVAVALLLVVAIVTVVGFQSWFNNYSSGIFTNTETKSTNSVSNTGVDAVIGNSLYIKNSKNENLTITEVKIDGINCDKQTIVKSNSISEIKINNCLSNIMSTNPEIVIYTKDKIYSKYFYKKQKFNIIDVYEVFNTSYPSGAALLIGEDIVVDNNKNIYVTGCGDSSIGEGFYTIKYDENGLPLWNKTYDAGNGFGCSEGIAIDSNNNIYVTGTSNNSVNFDYYTIKYDSNGNYIWNITYDGANNDKAKDVVVDNLGNVYVTGYSYLGGKNKQFTIKYDSNKNQIWNTTFGGGVGNDEAYGVAVDNLGNVYVVGRSNNGMNEDFKTIKYNSNGIELWNITYDSYSSDEANDVVVDNLGNVYVTGQSNSNYYTIKYNSTGGEIWNKTYNGGGIIDIAYDIILDNSNNVYITGFSYNLPMDPDFYTIKYDTNGNYLWNASYNGGPTISDQAYGIAIDIDKNVYVTGHSDFNYYTIKYAQP